MDDESAVEIRKQLDRELDSAASKAGIYFGGGLWLEFQRRKWIVEKDLFETGGIDPVYGDSHLAIYTLGLAEEEFRVGSKIFA